jgi:hypothetical protein
MKLVYPPKAISLFSKDLPMKLLYRLKLLGTGTLLLANVASPLMGANQVVVNAEALGEYLTERARIPEEKVQTYLFMKGKYYGGGISDPSMSDVSFEELVEDLAENLKYQQFFPESEGDEDQSDLLIVVHYGVTGGRPDSLVESMGYNSIEEMNDPFGNTGYVWEDTTDVDRLDGNHSNELFDEPNDTGPVFDVPNTVDPGVEFNYNASLSVEEAQNAASFKKAQLLGMEQAFDFHGSPRQQWELNTLINQERYFVVLNVYDFQKLRKGEKVLLWRTRYNIRSTGQPFDEAIQSMNQIAGDYFGTNQKALVMKRVSDDSRVKIGEIEVLDEPEEGLN